MKILILALLPFLVYGNNEWYREVLCDAESSTIRCKANEMISIEKAFYGRANDYECPGPNIKTTKCEAADTQELVSNECNGKTECTLSATTTFLGDPCEGTSKYLEVYFVCKPPPYHTTVVVCEGDSARLVCPPGKFIKIKNGFYGRDDWSTCPHPSNCDIDCTCTNAFDRVSAVCDGKRKCKISAMNSLFGDPCQGTHKYLKVTYKCKNKFGDSVCFDENGKSLSGDPFGIPDECNDFFYQCSNGVLHTKSCTEGTIFNPAIKVCDWPANVPAC